MDPDPPLVLTEEQKRRAQANRKWALERRARIDTVGALTKAGSVTGGCEQECESGAPTPSQSSAPETPPKVSLPLVDTQEPVAGRPTKRPKPALEQRDPEPVRVDESQVPSDAQTRHECSQVLRDSVPHDMVDDAKDRSTTSCDSSRIAAAGEVPDTVGDDGDSVLPRTLEFSSSTGGSSPHAASGSSSSRGTCSTLASGSLDVPSLPIAVESHFDLSNYEVELPLGPQSLYGVLDIVSDFFEHMQLLSLQGERNYIDML